MHNDVQTSRTAMAIFKIAIFNSSQHFHMHVEFLERMEKCVFHFFQISMGIKCAHEEGNAHFMHMEIQKFHVHFQLEKSDPHSMYTMNSSREIWSSLLAKKNNEHLNSINWLPLKYSKQIRTCAYMFIAYMLIKIGLRIAEIIIYHCKQKHACTQEFRWRKPFSPIHYFCHTSIFLL